MDPKSNYPQSQMNSTPPKPGDSSSMQSKSRQREAALSLVRGEIDAIYKGKHHINEPSNKPAAPQPAQPAVSSQSGTHQQVDVEQWKKYHSAWQTYYQKYYEQYYLNEMRKNISAQKEQYRNRSLSNAAVLAGRGGQLPTEATPRAGLANAAGNGAAVTEQGSDSPQLNSLNRIRQDIIGKAQQSARKARKSRHFIPIAAALTVCLVALLLQYNQVLIANVKAYVAPSNSQAQNIIIDPNADIPVGPESKMIIPKINVDAPIVYNVGTSEQEQLDAMANGIAHVRYPGAVAMPGQVGNAVFSAHSSSDWSDSGEYKFIFVQLERLVKDDVIYINYNSKRYAYKVFETKTVLPSDIGSVKYTGNDPIITLITCTPLGTAQKRFLVFAKQISPDPQGAPKAEQTAGTKVQTTARMAGTNPTLIERLFGR